MTNQAQLVGVVGGAIYSSGGFTQFVKVEAEASTGDMEGKGGGQARGK